MGSSERVSCDQCSEPETEALVRTVRLSVDRSQIDELTLCPGCFADWIDQYNREMRPEQPEIEPSDDSDLIID